MFTDLPWQLDVLVVEALISFATALVMTEFGYYQRTPQWGIALACTDLACIGLMLWAGHISWQHILYIVLYTWAVWAGLTKGFRREREDLRTTKEGKPIPKGGMQTFAAFMCLFVIALIVTG